MQTKISLNATWCNVCTNGGKVQRGEKSVQVGVMRNHSQGSTLVSKGGSGGGRSASFLTPWLVVRKVWAKTQSKTWPGSADWPGWNGSFA